jgi:hypothetical protein
MVIIQTSSFDSIRTACTSVHVLIVISAEAHARSVFLVRNSKIKNKIVFGAALILGAGGDDKHNYFFICPNDQHHL